MKICYINFLDWSWNTAHIHHILKTCEAFADAGHMVSLVTPFAKNDFTRQKMDQYSVRPNFPRYRVLCPGPQKSFKAELIFRAIFGIEVIPTLYFLHPDIIYTADFPLLYFFSKIPAFLKPNVPVVFEAHKLYSDTPGGKVSRRQEIDALRTAHSIVCISSGVRNGLISLGYAEENISVVPNAVDLSRFDLKRSNNPDVPVIIYVGSFDDWKGVDILVRAFALVVQKIPNSKLCLIGGNDGTVNFITALVQKLAIQQSVELTGYLPQKDVASYLSRANVAVLPNRKTVEGSYYTSPMKMFEYMASRVPIIASDLPSVREVLDDNIARLVPPEDPQALCEAILSLLMNPASAARMANNAYHKVQSSYDWHSRAEQITHILAAVDGTFRGKTR